VQTDDEDDADPECHHQDHVQVGLFGLAGS
jgi:hypothetical protein